MLHVLDQENGNTFRTKPENIAHEKYLYAIEQSDKTNYEKEGLERAFAEFEGMVAPVIRELSLNKTIPEGRDYSILINYIALMICRVPIMIKTFAESIIKIADMSIKMATSNEEKYQMLLEDLKKNGYEIKNYPDYEEFKEFLYSDRYTTDVNQNYKLKTIIDSTNLLIPILAQRKWSYLFVDETLGGFICSDNPVALVSKLKPTFYHRQGFAMANTEVSMPLSKNVAIVGKFEGNEESGFASPKGLAVLNSRTGMYSNRFIFSATDDFIFLNENGEIENRNDLIKAIKG